MAEKELSILVRAKGAIEAAKSIKKVDDAVGHLGVRGHAVATALGQGFERLAEAGLRSLGNAVGSGIKSLEDLERVTNATEGVLKSTGGAAGVTAQQVRDLANHLEDVTTADDKVIQGGENLLLTFTGIGKDVFPQAAAAMTNMAIAMAQGDVASADFRGTALQVGKALQDPVRGMTTLRRAGVAFTKQQEDQVKAMVKAGKTTEAQKFILAELEKEFGKAGEAAGKGFGGDMRRFHDAVEDAQQALARGLLPMLRRVADWLTQKLRDPAVIKAIEDFGKGLADGFDSVLSAAQKIPWGTIADAMKTVAGGAKAALDFFLNLPPWIQTAVITGWGFNKLTGGVAGSVVGELGKGLIKGVLGMNAGVVNINAGVVNGGGGVPGGAAAGGGVKGAIGGVVGYLGIVGLTVGAGQLIANAIGATPDHPADSASRDYYRDHPVRNPGRTPGSFQKAPLTGGPSQDERDAIRALERVRDAVETGRIDTVATAERLARYQAQQFHAAVRDVPAPVVNVTANTTVSVTTRDIAQKMKVSLKYGRVAS